ncbi:MAG: type II secretion system protein GspE, partial [Candidatus Binatia bacterium]
ATRLMHMGIQPYLIASAAKAFIAQRLVRRICTECKEKNSDTSKSPLPKEVLPFFYQGKGCETCRFTGFQGRIAIYEILQLSEPITELILKKASSDVIKKEAVRLGMKTLYQDGLKKIALGLTTPGEILMVTQSEL